MTEKIYIGTKIVAAEPMTDLEFAERHVGHPRLNLLTETPNPGYRVRYEDGYISWSPKEVFERCYREVSGKEQMLVMFGGTQWPPEMVEKLKINKIGGDAANTSFCGFCGKALTIESPDCIHSESHARIAAENKCVPAPCPGSPGSPEREAEQQDRNKRATRMAEALRYFYWAADVDNSGIELSGASRTLLKRWFGHVRLYMGTILGTELMLELREPTPNTPHCASCGVQAPKHNPRCILAKV